VIGARRAIAPSEFVGVRRGGDSGFAVALVALYPGEDIARVRVKERIRPALGGCPDLFEQFTRGALLPAVPVQLGQCGQGGEFFFDAIDGAGAGEGVVEAFLVGGEIAELQRRFTAQPSGPYKIAFDALDVRQLPSSLGKRQCLLRLPEPEMTFGEATGDASLGLLIA
jgi:hypothetical protein